jgi:predicted dinucleotide-binding enzyme
MNVGVLGSGIVGRTLAAKIALVGNDVMLGTRDVEGLLARTETGPMGTPPFSVWHDENPSVKLGTFAEAAAHADVLLNATAGVASLEALASAGDENLAGKLLIDVSNPLDFSNGRPPSLAISNTDSLAEHIQAAFPKAKVVKALNTLSRLRSSTSRWSADRLNPNRRGNRARPGTRWEVARARSSHSGPNREMAPAAT